MRASNLLPDGLIYRELIRRTSETHTLDDANYLLEEMMENGRTPAVDVLVDLVVGLSAMLEGCCNAGKGFLAKSILDKMDERKITDCDSWNILIIWLSDNMAIRKADELLCRMFIFSIVPDSATYSALVVGYCWLRKYEDDLQASGLYRKLGSGFYILLGLMEGLCQAGKIWRLLKYFIACRRTDAPSVLLLTIC
ncbi:pentatricopeptide repeat-containing protein At1g64100-like [Mangifera indica]|uniref:pentatricopeptide repeat-containing protein At1g64100-like n=1 Tax=Mangifera indica TaxID=29780 RepID=UPI001CFBA282|nr:pentatricopeptide repeat-containing protein At1g64100-like [Mangifera indica]